MKLHIPPDERRGATTIAVVLVLCVVTLLILTATLQWSSTNMRLTQRNNQYQRSVAVAEAATEKAISKIVADYKKGGEQLIKANMSGYALSLPNYGEDPQLDRYEFSDGLGQRSAIYVHQLATTEFRELTSRYKGLRGYSTPMRVIANVKERNTLFDITGAVRQDFEVATIPLFQFAIFYNIDLEIHPGALMGVTGPVYGNEDIYIEPGDTLTFYDNVLSAGKITLNSMPGDPLEPRKTGTVVFNGRKENGASALVLPVGTNNTPAAVREIVEVPPSGEAANSELGKERFYNKADLIITVSNTTTRVTSGRVNGFATEIPVATFDSKSNSSAGFLSRVSFNNAREGKTVNALQIDVGKLRQWNATNGYLRSVITNGDISLVYVVDYRTQSSTTQAGVRVANGSLLPSSRGLTVATPHPLYVWGDYNCPTAALGTTNTAATYPAALIGDAITILSASWTDANSTASLASRVASNTTVNAAILAGIVPTTSTSYSGGVENFPRFLESWSGKYFTYNGSMVVMFPSKYATSIWGGTGATFGIYDPPKRLWAFDQNFREITKLPPGTPMSRGVIRTSWKMVIPNSITVASP